MDSTKVDFCDPSPIESVVSDTNRAHFSFLLLLLCYCLLSDTTLDVVYLVFH